MCVCVVGVWLYGCVGVCVGVWVWVCWCVHVCACLHKTIHIPNVNNFIFSTRNWEWIVNLLISSFHIH